MAETAAHLQVKVGADLSEFSRKMGELTNQLSGMEKKIAPTTKKLENVGKTLSKRLTAPVLALGTASAAAAIDFESAFAGVVKTVDATDKELAGLRAGILAMSRDLPASASQIAGVAEAAGQLGIETPNILKFTRTMVDLGEATNLSADQAATALARFANVTGLSQDKFDRLGSTIVELGNSLATTEREIVEMSLRLAGAGKQIGLSQDQILAFAGALSSVGVEADAGGSAFSQLFTRIAQAVSKGGKMLETFASAAGQSSEQFRRAFREDAAGAIDSFIRGLGEIQASGGDTFAVLESLGITEIRLRDAVLRTAGAQDLLSRSLGIANRGWRENAALSKEAEQRYKTTAAELGKLRNAFVEVGISIGERLTPHIRTATGELKDFAAAWQDLPKPVQDAAIGMAGAAAAIGPLSVALAFMAKNAKAVKGAVALLAGAFAVERFIAAGRVMEELGYEVDGAGVMVRRAKEETQSLVGVFNVLSSQGPRVTTALQGLNPELQKIASGLAAIQQAGLGGGKVTPPEVDPSEFSGLREKMEKMQKLARPERLGISGLFAVDDPVFTGLLIPTEAIQATSDGLRQLQVDASEFAGVMESNFERLTEGASSLNVVLAGTGAVLREGLSDVAGQITGELVEGILTMQEGFRSLGDIVESFGRIAQRVFAQLVADLAAAVAKAAVLSAIASIFNIGTGGFVANLTNILWPARAAGGPVTSGKGYLVGEKGPELFVPNQSGKIIPNMPVKFQHEFKFHPVVLAGGDILFSIERTSDHRYRGGF